MKAIVPGHYYELTNFEANGSPQLLQFIQKEQNDKGEFVLIANGTTNEEVLDMLIDRMFFLNGLMPCRENSIAITKLQEALGWLHNRTTDRKARSVEGTYKP